MIADNGKTVEQRRAAAKYALEEFRKTAGVYADATVERRTGWMEAPPTEIVVHWNSDKYIKREVEACVEARRQWARKMEADRKAESDAEWAMEISLREALDAWNADLRRIRDLEASQTLLSLDHSKLQEAVREVIRVAPEELVRQLHERESEQ